LIEFYRDGDKFKIIMYYEDSFLNDVKITKFVPGTFGINSY